jgi:hypothetical protein
MGVDVHVGPGHEQSNGFAARRWSNDAGNFALMHHGNSVAER